MARNTTALTQLAGLSYFCRAMLYDLDIKFYMCAPTSLKKFCTGKGNAKKDIVILSVFKKWGFSSDNSDIADAYVLARIGESIINNNVKLTKTQIEVIMLLKHQLL